MSNNHHFVNNFRGNHRTFQNMPPNLVPPPPPPPPALFIAIPSQVPIEMLDKKIINNIEQRVPDVLTRKAASICLSNVRDKLRSLILEFNDLKTKEIALQNNADSLSAEDWKSAYEEIRRKQLFIKQMLVIDTESIKKSITKKAATRKRLIKRKIELKRATDKMRNNMVEEAMKIDDLRKQLQVNDMKNKEEAAKLQADVVLKEVSRMKHNAKKCINKLDSLRKLRKARMNTATGRGESVSEKEAEEFDGKIDKLKLLWAQKLISYEKEEEHLRAKLKQDSDMQHAAKESETEKRMASNLKKWRKALFGDSSATPQMNFNGDIGRFVAVRCQWDQYLNDAGTPLPVGWVVPSKAQ